MPDLARLGAALGDRYVERELGQAGMAEASSISARAVRTPLHAGRYTLHEAAP